MGIFKNLLSKFANTEAQDDVDGGEDSPPSMLKNKKLVNIIVIIVLGIILLLGMGSCGESNVIPLMNDDNRVNDSVLGFSGTIDIVEYRQMLERDVSDALSRMSGAGEVHVTISFEHGGERVLATDRQASEERTRDGDADSGRNNYRISIEDRVVLHGANNRGTNPIVVRETTPRVSGVLVVAEGANDEQIRLELHRAARAITGAPAHRVKVVTGN